MGMEFIPWSRAVWSSSELWVYKSVPGNCMAGQERRDVLSILTRGHLQQLPPVLLLRGQFCNTGTGWAWLQALIHNPAPPCQSSAGVQIHTLLPWNQPILPEWKAAGSSEEAESTAVKSHLHSTGKSLLAPP